MQVFEIIATQNYPNDDEETWTATIDGVDNLKAHIAAVCTSVTATSWVFTIVKVD